MEIQLQTIARLIGYPVRANILWTLLDGKAYTASELAVSADTSLQNISMHLNKLTKADLLTVEKQGRHRYFRFSRDEVAYAIEGLANLVQEGKRKNIGDKAEIPDVQYCRTCYDHLAGKIGVMITTELTKQKLLRLSEEKNFMLTAKGKDFFEALGIATEILKGQRRIFARPCLDWSERKYHLAGSLGAALLEKMLHEDWIRRTKNSRVIILTAKGRKELSSKFGIEI
ncbi:MAG: ArsR/SmtB family transcription factor [Chitinophagaceae bacterium]